MISLKILYFDTYLVFLRGAEAWMSRDNLVYTIATGATIPLQGINSQGIDYKSVLVFIEKGFQLPASPQSTNIIIINWRLATD